TTLFRSVPRPARHVGQKLNDVGTHRVVGEMVLDRPDRFEAERLGHVGQRQLVEIDLPVRDPAAGVLEDGGHSDVHAALLLVVASMVNARSHAWEAAMATGRLLESAS